MPLFTALLVFLLGVAYTELRVRRELAQLRRRRINAITSSARKHICALAMCHCAGPPADAFAIQTDFEALCTELAEAISSLRTEALSSKDHFSRLLAEIEQYRQARLGHDPTAARDALLTVLAVLENPCPKMLHHASPLTTRPPQG